MAKLYRLLDNLSNLTFFFRPAQLQGFTFDVWVDSVPLDLRCVSCFFSPDSEVGSSMFSKGFRDRDYKYRKSNREDRDR